jgi:hypothetical protein
MQIQVRISTQQKICLHFGRREELFLRQKAPKNLEIALTRRRVQLYIKTLSTYGGHLKLWLHPKRNHVGPQKSGPWALSPCHLMRPLPTPPRAKSLGALGGSGLHPTGVEEDPRSQDKLLEKTILECSWTMLVVEDSGTLTPSLGIRYKRNSFQWIRDPPIQSHEAQSRPSSIVSTTSQEQEDSTAWRHHLPRTLCRRCQPSKQEKLGGLQQPQQKKAPNEPFIQGDLGHCRARHSLRPPKFNAAAGRSLAEAPGPGKRHRRLTQTTGKLP